LAATIFSRVIWPVASALAIIDAASAFAGTDRIATAPAAPAKCARYSVTGMTGKPRGVLLNKSRRDFAGKFWVPPQV
jgi:hypothetical protein